MSTKNLIKVSPETMKKVRAEAARRANEELPNRYQKDISEKIIAYVLDNEELRDKILDE